MKNKSDIFNKITLKKYEEAVSHIKTVESKGRREEYPGFIEASNILDELYIYEKLKWYCSELSYRRIRHEEGLDHSLEDFRFMGHVFEVVEDNSATFENYGIVIFNEIRKIQEDQLKNISVPLSKIQNINNLILKSADILGVSDVIRALSILSGVAAAEINEGSLDVAKLFIHINHEIINRSYNQTKKFKLPPGMYKNIVTLMINIRDEKFYKEVKNELLESTYKNQANDKFDWVMRFIKTYKTLLSKKDADTYYNYCMGYIHFSTKEYQAAHEHLKSLKRKRGMFVNTSVKILHLKVLYEGYMNKLDIHIESIKNIEKILESYRKLLADEERKKHMSYQIKYHRSFMNNFRLLYNFQRKYDGILGGKTDKEEKQKRRNELRKIFTTPYHFDKWLVRKLEEIK